MVNHLCIFQEICIGIVANLMCHQSVASDLSKDQETVWVKLSLLCIIINQNYIIYYKIHNHSQWFVADIGYPSTVQLMFNSTHARVRLWNLHIKYSIYSLITCEHSKEQWHKHIFTCTTNLTLSALMWNTLVRIHLWTRVEYTLMECAHVECIHSYGVH